MTLPIDQYHSLLAKKCEDLTALLSHFTLPKLEVFASEKTHFRLRAEFRIWHDNGDLFHVMFDPITKRPYRVDQFPIASQLINQMMTAVMEYIRANEILATKLFQIDYLSTLSNQIAISFLYHKKLDEHWCNAAKALKHHLAQQGAVVQIIGRAAGEKIALDVDYVEETLSVAGKDYHYRQIENSFTQPNAKMNINMLEWAKDCTKNSQDDLLELYCGNGNFSIALADQFRQVLATEITKSSVTAAQYNIKRNHIHNLKIVRLSAEEFTQAIQGKRNFNRLKGVDLQSYQCNTVLVDPPRSGLDPQTLAFIQNYPKILYISCNPHTLAENLSQLCQTHRIARYALFDQFPYTHHIETGVWLIKKNKSPNLRE